MKYVFVIFILNFQGSVSQCPSGTGSATSPKGDCWKFNNTAVSWDIAIGTCNSNGGTLAPIMDSTDFSAFTSLIGTTPTWTNLMTYYNNVTAGNYKMWYSPTSAYPPTATVFMTSPNTIDSTDSRECIRVQQSPQTYNDYSCDGPFAFVCTAPKCPFLSNPSFNITFSSAFIQNGTTASLQCLGTTVPDGPTVLTCLNRTWSSAIPNCINVTTSTTSLTTSTTSTTKPTTSSTKPITSGATSTTSVSKSTTSVSTTVTKPATSVTTTTTAVTVTTPHASTSTKNSMDTTTTQLATPTTSHTENTTSFSATTVQTEFCGTSSCKNGGTCSNKPNSFYCSCPVGYYSNDCSSNDPLSPTERLVVTIIHPLGCSLLIGFVSASFVLFLIFRDFSTERILQMGQEVSLVIAHSIILTQIFHTTNEISCIVVAISLQYFFICNFVFLTLESLQTFSVLQNVVSIGGFFSRKVYILIGAGLPAIVVLITAPFLYKDYPTQHSCWLNVGRRAVAASTLLPIASASFLMIVLTEAATILDAKRFPLTPEENFTAALFRQKGATIILVFNLASMLFGVFAVYKQDVAAYSVVLAMNITLGVFVFILHTFSNNQVYKFLKEKVCRRKIN